MEYLLQTKGLIKTFIDGSQETEVLKGIDLSIASGEFVAVTGASGTGKSTLLHQLGLLDDPTGGSVFIDGTNASDLSTVQRSEHRLRRFGFVFQDYALIPELTAWENIALPVLMRGASRSLAKNRAVRALKQLGMEDRATYRPSQLSGGESQRVSVARAIVHKPDILFADEPTANLDSERSRQIIDIFHDLHKSGQTIVMVTHEIEYAKEATRLIVLHDGRVQQDKKLRRRRSR
ncbi:MAG: ABC transporter ATP-binding protein [Candidatus Kaiserbacteria bacterium]|nr:ABC transporter ATP-binding protein [Candidatus Kaiserbacteria bacterium]